MKRTAAVLHLLMVCGINAVCGAGPAPIKTLVVTGGHGFEQAPFFQMFADNRELAVTRATHVSKADASVYGRADLLDYDVVVLYDMPQGITEQQKTNFKSLFAKGTGLVVLHHALVSYQAWPEYERIIGGRYPEPDPAQPGKVTEAVGWRHDVDLPVVIAATNHPVTVGLRDFVIHDEIYWGFRVGRDVTPLLTTTHPRSGNPLAWTRTEGKSRVVFIALGHGKEAFANPNYRTLLAQSIRWAANQPGSRAEGANEPRVFLMDARKVATARQRLHQGDPELAPALAALVREANGLLGSRLVSVMDKKPTPPSGDKHDYMSQAPYFWPNPNTSNGLPYVRRDGERNPEIGKSSDHANILGMPEKVQTLALAWYFTGEEKYADKAAAFLRTWFLEPATRMHPHFLYAQAIPGVNTGRGIGLIESRGLVHVVDAVGLLAGSKAWTAADQQGLQEWFEQFLKWMLESPHGRDEAAAKNNHGTYYDLQVASYGLFVGKRELAKQVLENAKQKRIAVQIEPDGRQPLELARTKAWSYSTGNLSGLMSLAEIGERVSVDLWGFQTADGRSIPKAFEYLLPYGTGEKRWPHQQLGGGAGEGFGALLRRAAAHYPEANYRTLAGRVAAVEPSSRERLLR